MSNDYLYELLESGSMNKKEFDFCVKYGLVDLDVIEENINLSSIHDAKDSLPKLGDTKHTFKNNISDSTNGVKKLYNHNVDEQTGKKKVVLKTEPTDNDKNDEEHVKRLKSLGNAMLYKIPSGAASVAIATPTLTALKRATEKYNEAKKSMEELKNKQKGNSEDKSEETKSKNESNQEGNKSIKHEDRSNESDHDSGHDAGSTGDSGDGGGIIDHIGHFMKDNGYGTTHVVLGTMAGLALAKGGYHLYKHMRFKKKTKPTFDEAHKAATESLKKTHPELAVHADKEIRNDVNKVISANKDNFKDNHEDTHKMIVNHFKSDKYKQELANRFNQNKK